MIKQIKDLSEATIDNLNDNCSFVMDDSTGKTKKVFFNVLKQKIGSGGESSELFMGVPNYAAYDPSKHDVLVEDVTTFGNNSPTIMSYGYEMTLAKSVFGSKIFKATENCYFFPFAYAYANTPPEGSVFGEAYPLAVFVGENDHNENMFRVFASDMSVTDNMFAWMVPLKKGQILAIWNAGIKRSDIYGKCFWLPMHSIANQEEILNLIYPVGSIYLDISNGEVCPLKSSITGSEWYKTEAKLLTDSSTAPVVGNGTALGLTNGSDNVGLQAYTGSALGPTIDNYGKPVDAVPRLYSSVNGALGVTTDGSKSGLVANLGEITGVTIAIWKRVS